MTTRFLTLSSESHFGWISHLCIGWVCFTGDSAAFLCRTERCIWTGVALAAIIYNKVPVCCVVMFFANCILTIKRRQGLTYSNSKLGFLEKSQDLLGIGATCSHVGCVQMHFAMWFVSEAHATVTGSWLRGFIIMIMTFTCLCWLERFRVRSFIYCFHGI